MCPACATGDTQRGQYSNDLEVVTQNRSSKNLTDHLE
jgi:hypothetical protein